jgi:type IV pilus assembly protein PilM
MLKEIFLPEKTRRGRLISKRIVGIAIDEEHISAAQVYATPSVTVIEKLFEKPTITSIIPNLDSFDQLRIALPSTIVTFKELTLPFVDHEKIKMVVEYEVEPQLPFPISDAVIDFIVTSVNHEEQTSQVLVAAVRTKDLQGIVDIYQQVDLDPDAITVDLFSIYSLYQQIPEYSESKKASAIVEIGKTNTSIAFILDGALRLVRTIGKGIYTIAEHITQDCEMEKEEAITQLNEFGMLTTKNTIFNQATQKYVTTFLNDIQFTLNSFSLKLNYYDDISKILLVGKSDQIKGFSDFASTTLQIPCEPFSCNKLLKTHRFKNKTKQATTNWAQYVVALGTAIPFAPYDECNLRKKEFARTHFPLINKQIITAGILTIALFATIITRGYFQISNLSHTAKQRETRAIRKLKQIFPPGSPSRRKNKLFSLMKDADREIADRKEAWAPFLQENLQPIQILQDLTQTIDKRMFNVKTEKISMQLDDQGTPIGEISGIFRSKPGEHFTDYARFTEYFKQQSKLLTLIDEDGIPLEEGKGVKFTFKFKLKTE